MDTVRTNTWLDWALTTEARDRRAVGFPKGVVSFLSHDGTAEAEAGLHAWVNTIQSSVSGVVRSAEPLETWYHLIERCSYHRAPLLMVSVERGEADRDYAIQLPHITRHLAGVEGPPALVCYGTAPLIFKFYSRWHLKFTKHDEGLAVEVLKSPGPRQGWTLPLGKVRSDLPKRTLSEASTTLKGLRREGVFSSTFGDEEVYWEDPSGNEIASGYFGRDVSEVEFGTGEVFKGRRADTLRYEGQNRSAR